MFSTWDRYPAATDRRLRDARPNNDSMGEFLTSIDVMMYAAGAALAATVLAIVLT
jgi:hypothetical protein